MNLTRTYPPKSLRSDMGDLRYHGEGNPRQFGCTGRGDGRDQRNEQGRMLRKTEKTVRRVSFQ